MSIEVFVQRAFPILQLFSKQIDSCVAAFNCNKCFSSFLHLDTGPYIKEHHGLGHGQYLVSEVSSRGVKSCTILAAADLFVAVALLGNSLLRVHLAAKSLRRSGCIRVLFDELFIKSASVKHLVFPFWHSKEFVFEHWWSLCKVSSALNLMLLKLPRKLYGWPSHKFDKSWGYPSFSTKRLQTWPSVHICCQWQPVEIRNPVSIVSFIEISVYKQW